MKPILFLHSESGIGCIQRFLKPPKSFPLLRWALIWFLNEEQSSPQSSSSCSCKPPLSYPSCSFFSCSMFLGKINSANVQIYGVQPHGNLFQGHMNSYYLKPFTVNVEKNKVHFPIKDLKPFFVAKHMSPWRTSWVLHIDASCAASTVGSMGWCLGTLLILQFGCRIRSFPWDHEMPPTWASKDILFRTVKSWAKTLEISRGQETIHPY